MAGLAIVGLFLPAYPLTLLTQALILGILAMSLDVLLGYTGLPSLGHAGYFGVAAYAVALLSTPRPGHLFPHDHPRSRDGRVGAGLSLGLPDQGRQRCLRSRPAGARHPQPLRSAALLLLLAGVRGGGLRAPGTARRLALRARAQGDPGQRVAHGGPGLQRVAPQVPRLRDLGRLRGLGRRPA